MTSQSLGRGLLGLCASLSFTALVGGPLIVGGALSSDAHACGKDLSLTAEGAAARASGNWDPECTDPTSRQHLGTFARVGSVNDQADACSAVTENENALNPSETFVQVAAYGGKAFRTFHSRDGINAWTSVAVTRLPNGFSGARCPDPHMINGELVCYFEANVDGALRFWRMISTDAGRSWTTPVEVLRGGGPNDWDTVRRSPSVIKRTGTFPGPNPDRYLMAYWAYPKAALGKAQIGLAHSVDGVFWRPEADPIVEQPGGQTWNGYVLSRPRLVEDPLDPDVLHIFYAGFDHGRCSRMGYACSHDGGGTWNHLIDPVFGYGQPGDWDHDPDTHPLDKPTAYVPSLTTVGANNDVLRMYYSGSLGGATHTEVGAAEARWSIVRQLCPLGASPESGDEESASWGRSKSSDESAVSQSSSEENGLLLSMRPNPSSASADLHFTLAQGENVKIDVYDSSGRHVRSLADGYRAGGSHRVALKKEGLSAGVYSIVYRSRSHEESVRFVLTR